MNETLAAFLPLILIFVVFYFLLIRPQQKKIKNRKEMISKVKRGDKILTAGGIYCKVTRVIDETQVEVEIANGVKILISKPTITDVISSSDSPDHK